MMSNNIPENIVNNYAAGLVFINSEENSLDEKVLKGRQSVTIIVVILKIMVDMLANYQ